MNRSSLTLLITVFVNITLYGKNIEPDSIWIDVIQESPRRYAVGTIVTFQHPLMDIAEVLMDFDNYPTIFSYCTIFHKLPADSCSDDRATYFAEAKGSIIRVIGFGAIDSLCFNADSSDLSLKVTQNVSDELKELGRKRARGWFTIQVSNINLRATLTSIDESSCRLVVNAWGNPDVHIPKWILRFAAKTGFPQFIKDVERSISRQANQHLEPFHQQQR